MKISRKDPCLCGSEKKYKHCCLSRNNQLDPITLEILRKMDYFIDNSDTSNISDTIAAAITYHSKIVEDNFSKANLSYCIATAYSALCDLQEFQNNKKNAEDDVTETSTLNNIEEIEENMIYYFQESIDIINNIQLKNTYDTYVKQFLKNVFTNFASALDKIGRVVTAIYYYRKAIELDNNFLMSLGNLGLSLQYYSQLSHDILHRDVLNFHAYKLLNKAIEYVNYSDENKSYASSVFIFKYYINKFSLEYIESSLSTEPHIDISFKTNKSENSYRTWILKNNLFLNELNELYDICLQKDAMSFDSICLSNILFNQTDMKFLGMFNQIKQEFIAARLLLYEASTHQAIHMADKHTNLDYNIDDPIYSIHIEKLKLAYRSFYSLFDKIAFFINEYYNLGIKERDISFRSIWRSEKTGRNGYEYKNILDHEKNFALKGLYWLSKDLYEPQNQTTKPRSFKFDKIRNCLEHKYLKIYSNDINTKIDGSLDSLAVYLSDTELYTMTHELAHMIREAVIYLSSAIFDNIKKNRA